MNWHEEQHHLTEQLEILKKLRERFGEEVIHIASRARLAVHKRWMETFSTRTSGRPSDIFTHSAFSVTAAEDNFFQYDVLEDSADTFTVNITTCKYADFYRMHGEPKIGYALHCALDFGEAEAFSADIILKRTHTLMQGDTSCDHCYERKHTPDE